MTICKYEGKNVQVIDVLVSPTSHRQIAIVRQGLNTFPVDASDLEPKPSVAVPQKAPANAAFKKAKAPWFSVEFNDDRADIEFEGNDNVFRAAYGFVREETPDGYLQAVSYAIQVLRDRISQCRGLRDD